MFFGRLTTPSSMEKRRAVHALGASKASLKPPMNETKLLHAEDFNRGIDLFNRARFFDAHEVLEDFRRPLSTKKPSRRHVQGMIQLAVAFHHHSTGNYVGALSVLDRATRNLHGAEDSFPDLDLDALRVQLSPWRQFLTDHGGAGRHKSHGSKIEPRNPPALPKIVRRGANR